MRQGSRSIRSAGWGALLGVLSTTLGGPAVPVFAQTRPPAQFANVVLGPRVTVAWTIQAAKLPPTLPRTGEGVVGPTGLLEIGAYGSILVSGMSAAQAANAIEAHLSKYVYRPEVQLRIVGYNLRPPVILRAQLESPVLPVAAEFPDPDPASPPATEEPSASVEVVNSPELSTPPLLVPEISPPLVRPAVPPSPTVCNTEWRPVVHLDTPSNVKRANFQAAAGEPSAEKLNVPPRAMPAGPGGEPAASPVPVTDGGYALAPEMDAGSCPDGGLHMPPVPRECAYQALPTYVVEPPDVLILYLAVTGGPFKVNPISREHLVRPDGTISLGIFGDVKVAGMTLDQVKQAIYNYLTTQSAWQIKPDALQLKDISVDVLAYNSKFYYVITDGGGYGEQVQRFPITGKETVLDAISQIQGLPPVASKCRIWVARTPCAPYGTGKDQELPVDWIGITQRGDSHTNYQLVPGDRVYVDSQRIIRADTALAKIISPIERILGVTLLGATTYNTIANRGGGGTGR
jgi:polysaccharide export outer membrane protein